MEDLGEELGARAGRLRPGGRVPLPVPADCQRVQGWSTTSGTRSPRVVHTSRPSRSPARNSSAVLRPILVPR